jgi:hypothetical protein
MFEFFNLLHWTEREFETHALDQAWATYGPRATSGPRSTLMWPASYNSEFYIAILYRKHVKIPENFYFLIKIASKSYFFYAFSSYSNLKENLLALGYLTCLSVARGAKRVAHPCFRQRN